MLNFDYYNDNFIEFYCSLYVDTILEILLKGDYGRFLDVRSEGWADWIGVCKTDVIWVVKKEGGIGDFALTFNL